MDRSKRCLLSSFLVGKGGFLRIGQFVVRCVELIKNDDGCWGRGWSTVLQVKGFVCVGIGVGNR